MKHVDDLKLKMCLYEAYLQGPACLRQLLLVMKSGNLPTCSSEAVLNVQMFITCLRAHVDLEVIASLSYQVARSRFRSHNFVSLFHVFLSCFNSLLY